MKTNLKVAVQSFGRFLSGMVMPNIGAFIAWGFITALFIPTGWYPNEDLAKLVGPMITYLLPLLIGYSGGKLIAGERGGVVGAITTAGVIVGTSIPMFIGAMIAGPAGGYAIKKVDEFMKDKVKSGFEMLVNNFSAGIVGAILAVLFFKSVGPLVEGLNNLLGAGVNFLVEARILPLTSILVEPAKVLFLNNAINHGVFSPLGIQQVSETGKSIFFLIESNPGPGLGILLAYMLFGKGASKESASGAAIIHFFGGIHEIYFPYILMKPILLLAAIAGGMTGVFVNVVFNAGLIAPPSPGSIFAIMAMAPKGGLIPVLLSVIASGAVSFLVGSAILKASGKEDLDLEKAKEKMGDMKGKKVAPVIASGKTVSKIVVACDAGMGSSAMGASVLRKKITQAGLNIEVTNRAISNLSEDIDIVITHRDLTARAEKMVSKPQHMSIDNFMNGEFYDSLVESLKGKTASTEVKVEEKKTVKIEEQKMSILKKEGIFINQKSVSKKEAIELAGKALSDLGYTKAGYNKFMQEREEMSTTYIGNFVAIPHGTTEGKSEVLNSGIVIFQYPNGVDFGNGNIAHFVVGIAGQNDEHLDIISNIADVIEEEEVVLELKDNLNAEELYKTFNF